MKSVQSLSTWSAHYNKWESMYFFNRMCQMHKVHKDGKEIDGVAEAKVHKNI